MSSDSEPIAPNTMTSETEPIIEDGIVLFDGNAPFCCDCGWKIDEWGGFCLKCDVRKKMKCFLCENPRDKEENRTCNSCAWSLVHVVYTGCHCCPEVTECMCCGKEKYECECAIEKAHEYLRDPEHFKCLMICSQ
jgi:hypothetical protein